MNNTFHKLISWYFSKKSAPYWCIFLMDCAIFVLSGYFIFGIVYGLQTLGTWFLPLTGTLFIYLLAFIVGFRMFHTYAGVIRFSSFVDLQRITMAMLVGTAIMFVMRWLMPEDVLVQIGRMTLVSTVILATLLMWMVRVFVKYLYDVAFVLPSAERVLIFGTGNGAVSLTKSIRNQANSPYDVLGFVSPEKRGTKYRLMGLRVYFMDDRLVEHMQHRGVKGLMVSPLQSTYFREQSELIDDLLKAGIHIYMMPDVQEWDGKNGLDHANLKEVEVEDLLPREIIEVDMMSIGAKLEGKRILITGAAGSIGSEMVRQIAKCLPSELVLIDQAETPMHDIRLLMVQKFPDVKARTIVASINNASHMEGIFRQHRPDYVFHAAAYKHVPMMEDNPAEAVQNNIYGTRVIADLAVKYGTKKFVMISTDKAVNPTNVMGCSKRICEIYCQSLNKAIKEGKVQGCTQFITTRFGNVLGSNGSVIPIFREQIRNGGPVTVTHPDIIRFFMLIPEACRLVLEAGTMGRGGEIFVFDMGKPVRIAELAQRMIDLSGAKDVKIAYSGLRDGEKLYEELLNKKEEVKPTFHEKIKIAKVREYAYEEALKNEEELYKLSFTYDDMAIVRKMKEIVPEFKSRHSKYEVLDEEKE